MKQGNTCLCEKCKGPDDCHYSSYYHREEGFDGQHKWMVKQLTERIEELKLEIRNKEQECQRLREGFLAVSRLAEEIQQSTTGDGAQTR